MSQMQKAIHQQNEFIKQILTENVKLKKINKHLLNIINDLV